MSTTFACELCDCVRDEDPAASGTFCAGCGHEAAHHVQRQPAAEETAVIESACGEFQGPVGAKFCMACGKRVELHDPGALDEPTHVASVVAETPATGTTEQLYTGCASFTGPAGAKFCMACGKPADEHALAARTLPEPDPEPVSTSTPVTAQPAATAFVEPQVQASTESALVRILVAGLVSIVLIACAVVGSAVYWRGRIDDREAEVAAARKDAEEAADKRDDSQDKLDETESQLESTKSQIADARADSKKLPQQAKQAKARADRQQRRVDALNATLAAARANSEGV